MTRDGATPAGDESQPRRGNRKSPIPGWGRDAGPPTKRGPAATPRAGRPATSSTREAATRSAADLDPQPDREPGRTAGDAAFPVVPDDSPIARTRPRGNSRVGRAVDALLRRPMLVTGLVVALLAGGLGLDYVLRSASAPEAPPPTDPAPEPLANPRDVPLPENVAGLCRVYTRGDTGFTVLVDGEPVWLDDGELLTTPCEITLDARDAHRVTVAKDGFRDATKLVTASAEEPTELVFEPEPDESGTAVSMLDAAYFSAEPGVPIELAALNTPARESDPHVTPDGLTIYFVRESPAESGVHVATRATPFDAFGEPAPVNLTVGFDRPASPSVAVVESPGGELHTHLAYALPEKGRVQSVVKRNVLGEFEDRAFLRYDAEGTRVWPVAQMLRDGRGLYWSVLTDGELQTFFSAREDVEEEFRSTLAVRIPGGPPRMTGDGLRHYVYDGHTLRRARRNAVVEWTEVVEKGRRVSKPVHVPFTELEDVAELELPNFTPRARHRQCWVSDDEQWLFYADDPETGGDLFVCRIRNGRGWGHAPTGRPITDRSFAPEPEVAAADPPRPEDEPFEPPKEQADPRSRPLPYARHREEFRNRLAERRVDEAAALCAQRLDAEEFAADRNLLAWDLADVERIREFWRLVDAGASSLKAGDTFNHERVKLDFVSYADGTLTGAVGDKQVPLDVRAMSPTDAAALADRTAERTNAEQQAAIATFLFYEPDVVPRAVETRLERAGERGAEFLEQLAARLLQRAEQEFARENHRAGLALLTELRERFPDSRAASRSQEVESELYRLVTWQKVGSRAWESGPDGAHAAGPERAADSWLQSERTYEDFELLMEYRTTAAFGSGGVFFRYPGGRRKPYQQDAAFKIQLADDAGVPPDRFCTGALFGETAPAKNAAKPRGEWNTFRLQVEGRKVKLWINGEPVLETTAVNEEIPLAGHVCLDGITGGISYRKVLLVSHE